MSKATSMPGKDLQCATEIGVEQNKEKDQKIYIEISKRTLEESEGIKWEEDGEIECGFDYKIVKLIIKGKGSLEDYADGSNTCK